MTSGERSFKEKLALKMVRLKIDYLRSAASLKGGTIEYSLK